MEALAGVEFCVNDDVMYWSDTHGIWMDAVVVRINFSAGASPTRDLDVKGGARADCIRKAEGPPRTPAARKDGELPGDGIAAAERPASAACPEAAAEDGDRTGMPVGEEFSVDENVMYWSDTRGMDGRRGGAHQLLLGSGAPPRPGRQARRAGRSDQEG